MWFGIGLSVKRLHDHDKSGLWFFVYFIPVAGFIWQLIECGLLRGTEGDNDYGPDPRFRFSVSTSSSSETVIVLELAWYPRWARIIWVNS